MNWTNLGILLGGVAYVVGFFTVLHDVLEDGKSMKEYRNKYGKDIGMALCVTHRSIWPTFWPATVFLVFAVGVLRDSIRLVTGKAPRTLEK